MGLCRVSVAVQCANYASITQDKYLQVSGEMTNFKSLNNYYVAYQRTFITSRLNGS